MVKLKHIKKDQGGPPDYYYVMPNGDRIDISVSRYPDGNRYTCALPAPHGVQTFYKMAHLKDYLFEHFETD